MNKRVFIDLFAGAGGLSEGFVTNGFYPVAHVENETNSSLTLKTRMAYHHLKEKNRLGDYYSYLEGELSRDELYNRIPEDILNTVINLDINENNIRKIFNRIDRNLGNIGRSQVDAVVGGPPCQAYSLVGRARDQYRMRNDSRNYLYKMYVKFLKYFEPNVFVFENVLGLLSAGGGGLFEDVQKHFDRAGYEIDYAPLNALNFGVLQNRKRIILIGWKRGLDLEYPQFNSEKNGYLVNEVLEDLPPLEPGVPLKNEEYAAPPTEYLKNYGLRNGRDKLTLHVARPHNDRDREIYRRAIKLWNERKRRLKYTDLPKKYRTHKNTKSFLDRFKVVADNLPYSHTVVSHIAKDGHYYIHPDISQLRSLSIREAARLQSFPDDYYFEGAQTPRFNQIGNAVPPLMGGKIASKIGKMLEGI